MIELKNRPESDEAPLAESETPVETLPPGSNLLVYVMGALWGGWVVFLLITYLQQP